jgi:hypothetical protein
MRPDSPLISDPSDGPTLTFTDDLDDALMLEISNDFGEFVDINGNR